VGRPSVGAGQMTPEDELASQLSQASYRTVTQRTCFPATTSWSSSVSRLTSSSR